jgi:hypothetical protein
MTLGGQVLLGKITPEPKIHLGTVGPTPHPSFLELTFENR